VEVAQLVDALFRDVEVARTAGLDAVDDEPMDVVQDLT
jgi:hypothetical protein